MNMIRIRTDDLLFIISKKRLENHADSTIYKAIFNNESNDYIHMDSRDNIITLYIDCDPDVMKIIVKLLRGEKFKDTYRSDLLIHTLNMLNLNIIPSNELFEKYMIGGNNSIDTFSTIHFNKSDINTSDDTLGLESMLKNNITNGSETNNFSEFSKDVKSSIDAVLHMSNKEKDVKVGISVLNDQNDNKNKTKRKVRTKLLSVDTVDDLHS